MEFLYWLWLSLRLWLLSWLWLSSWLWLLSSLWLPSWFWLSSWFDLRWDFDFRCGFDFRWGFRFRRHRDFDFRRGFCLCCRRGFDFFRDFNFHPGFDFPRGAYEPPYNIHAIAFIEIDGSLATQNNNFCLKLKKLKRILYLSDICWYFEVMKLQVKYNDIYVHLLDSVVVSTLLMSYILGQIDLFGLKVILIRSDCIPFYNIYNLSFL